MTTKEDLISQHVREYESRLKHVDELYERAHKATEHLEDNHETRSELNAYAERRSQMEKAVEDVKTIDAGHWREETVSNAGPMAIWDVLAQQLEDFVEKHE